jgi:XTP/dITP diphosphohydrolase
VAFWNKKTGDGGFGYDPIFWVPEHQCSAAEITAEQKHAISHRGKAMRQLLDQFQAMQN